MRSLAGEKGFEPSTYGFVNDIERKVLKADKMMQDVVSEYFLSLNKSQGDPGVDLVFELNEKKHYGLIAEIAADYLHQLKKDCAELYTVLFPDIK